MAARRPFLCWQVSACSCRSTRIANGCWNEAAGSERAAQRQPELPRLDRMEVDVGHARAFAGEPRFVEIRDVARFAVEEIEHFGAELERRRERIADLAVDEDRRMRAHA